SFQVLRRTLRKLLPFGLGKPHAQGPSNSFSDIALDTEDVSQLPIVGLCPEVEISLRVNQLHIDPHPISRSLHAALKNVRHAKLLCDLGKIPGFALILLRGRTRNYF